MTESSQREDQATGLSAIDALDDASAPRKWLLLVRYAAPGLAALALVLVIAGGQSGLDEDLHLIIAARAAPAETIPVRALLYTQLRATEGPILHAQPVDVVLETVSGRVLSRTRLMPSRAGTSDDEGELRVPGVAWPPARARRDLRRRPQRASRDPSFRRWIRVGRRTLRWQSAPAAAIFGGAAQRRARSDRAGFDACARGRGRVRTGVALPRVRADRRSRRDAARRAELRSHARGCGAAAVCSYQRRRRAVVRHAWSGGRAVADRGA